MARAREAGLAGLVLKSHEYPTQPLAWTLDREFSGIDVYGGVALDWGVGGLNPEAASITLRIGGKVVWMPTFDALHWRGYRPGGFNSPQEPITVLDEDGKLLPVCHDILDVIASHDAVLASGHLSPEETQAILGEGLARGIRCVITHASFWTPIEVQQEIVSKGGYIEQCAIAIAREDGEEVWPDLLRQVREVGPERVILSSDHGQASNPEPVAALGLFGERFVEAGFGEARGAADAVGESRNPPRLKHRSPFARGAMAGGGHGVAAGGLVALRAQSTGMVTGRVMLPKVGSHEECLPGPPATMTWMCSGPSAMGARASRSKKGTGMPCSVCSWMTWKSSSESSVSG